jgi:hypothetical protein
MVIINNYHFRFTNHYAIWNCSTILKRSQIRNFMEVGSAVLELCHAYRRTDRQTERLDESNRCFFEKYIANAPKNFIQYILNSAAHFAAPWTVPHPPPPLATTLTGAKRFMSFALWWILLGLGAIKDDSKESSHDSCCHLVVEVTVEICRASFCSKFYNNSLNFQWM